MKITLEKEDLRKMYDLELYFHCQDGHADETFPDFLIWLSRRQSKNLPQPQRLFFSEILNAYYLGKNHLHVKSMEFFEINERRLQCARTR